MTICFIWQGISGRYGVWQDGLREAMRIIERKHKVLYREPWDDFGNADVLLYWEAPCTINGKDRDNYLRVASDPRPKALLFAGGEIRKEWLSTFDMVFTESQINDDELEALGVPHMRAFGVNNRLFRPMNEISVFDGVMHATFADWKRHTLFAEALGNQGLAIGRKQEHDLNGYNACQTHGVTIIPELHGDPLVRWLNKAHAVVNTSSEWGGGQRCTLEAMACGIPVIVMADSPKNREYVEESGAGLVVEPTVAAIRQAVEMVKEWGFDQRWKGVEYIRSKWTAEHYAKNLLKGIKQIT